MNAIFTCFGKVMFSVVFFAGILGSYAQIPAFPTAEGYGMYATGGRGGHVVEVTNLLDNHLNPPVGSFRWALEQGVEEIKDPIIGTYSVKRPLTVVFRISGIIDLKGHNINCKRKGLTIAGQTAPGDGICIRGGKVNLGGSENMIIRHLRFRMGLVGDSAFAEGGAIGIENAKNFIIDHCSFGWSGEENMTIYDNKMTTVQWCIVHEGLYASGHAKGARSYAAQWGGETATYHHNLLAHNVSRTPRFNGSKNTDVKVIYDYVNNVNYNWGKENSPYGAYIEIKNGSWSANIINNYYKPGPARPGILSSYFVQSSYGSTMGNTLIAKWHMSGNFMEGTANADKNADNYLGLDASGYESVGVPKSMLVAAAPFTVAYPVNAESAIDAYNSVLEKAGAFPRDTVDRRIVHEVRTGTATGKGTTEKHLDKDGISLSNNPYFGIAKGIIDNPVLAFGVEASYPEYKTYNSITDNDHDGMDDAWEIANGLDPTNPDDRNKLTKSGYTCLEVYLNGLVGENIEMAFSGVSVPNVEKRNVKVFFDDSKSFLFLQSNHPIQKVVMFKSNGVKVLEHNGHYIGSIDVSQLPKGLYVVLLSTGNALIERIKVVK